MTIHRGLSPSAFSHRADTKPADRRNQRAAARPISKMSFHLGRAPVFGQNLHGPRYPGKRIHHCGPAGSFQKINLVVTSWSRGEFQGRVVLGALQVHQVVSQSDRGSEGFHIGTAQQQPRISTNHVRHKAHHLLFPSPIYRCLRMLSAAIKSPELHLGARLNHSQRGSP